MKQDPHPIYEEEPNPHRIYLFLFSIISLILLINGVSAVGNSPSVTNDMVLYYHFNNQSGLENDTYVYDWSGNGNSGTAINTNFLNSSLTQYLDDGSLYFNGVNASINVSNLAITQYVNKSRNYTIVGIFNFTVDNPTYQMIIFASSTGISNTMNIEISNNKLIAGHYNGSAYIGKKSSSTLLNNTLYFFTYSFTSDGIGSSNSYANLTVNAVEQTGTTQTSISGNVGVTIGKRQDNIYNFTGTIGELIIYNRSMNSSEVSSLYNNFFECNQNPYLPCIISKSTTFSGLNYYLNQNLPSISNYINVVGNNTVLNANGTKIYWGYNSSNTAYAINILKVTNFTINNLSLINLNCSIYCKNIILTNSSNINLINNMFYSTNNLPNLIYSINSSNVYIYNNNLTDYVASHGACIDITEKSYNVSVINNIIDVYGNYSTVDIDGIDYRYGTSNSLISNNTIILTHNNAISFGIQLVINISNILVNNNNIYVSGNYVRSVGLKAENHINNISVLNNFMIINSTGLSNQWGEGLSLDTAVTNSTFSNNYVVTYGNYTHALAIQNDNNLALPYDTLSNNLIYNNSFITYGLNSYGMRILNFVDFSKNTSIINNNFSNNYIRTYNTDFQMFLNNYVFNNTFNNYFYSIFINNSLSNTFYNMTNALFYTFNGSSNICSGICSSLVSTNYEHILDNYNITEGYSRFNDPISITSSGNSKIINSQLSNSITAPSYIDLGDCSTKNDITYLSNRYQGQAAHDFCNNLKSGLTLEIDPGTNTISYTNGTTSTSSSILQILIVLLGVGLLIVTLSFAYLNIKDNFTEIPFDQFAKYCITVLIILILEIALMVYISTLT